MKYHIITYGCQMNKSDSQRIAAQLEKKGYKPAQKLSAADLVIINVCSVRQSAVDRVYSKIKQLNSQKIILTGCILEKDKKQLTGQVDEIWPIIDLKAKPTHHRNKFGAGQECRLSQQAFVPIMTGCNNFCSYCVVPYTRGLEYSRPAKEIIQEIKDLVKQGYREITLLGQNVNSYQGKGQLGFDIEDYDLRRRRRSYPKGRTLNPTTLIDFPKLLQLLNRLPGNFQIKFLTSHPKDMSDELIKVISQSKKISQEIHLPVQSADNQILKKMNRGYTISHYKKLIKKIRRAIPQVQISTDVIVGFPGETKKQFQKTVNLVKEIGFSQAYVAVYSPRSGTTAAKLKNNIPSDEKKRRKKIILNLVKYKVASPGHGDPV